MASSLRVSAAQERGGCQFRRVSAEEAAGGGGIVQSRPLSVHFHPGPCSQGQRTAPTAKKLNTGPYSKTGKYADSLYWIKSAAETGEKKLNKTTRHFTLCDSFL